MKKFEFSTEKTIKPATTFNGSIFYNVYKDSQFLLKYQNIEEILWKSHEIRHQLKTMEPGSSIVISDMYLERNTPLVVKNTGKGVNIEDYEFTQNRLTGLAAAYAYDNRHNFPNMKSSEAAVLGLTWDNNDAEKCKLYLSAVTGSEHFIDQFSFWPLICAIKKLQLNKLPEGLVMKVANIKDKNGDRLAKVLTRNYNTAVRVWMMFPNSAQADLHAMLSTVSKNLKQLFRDV